MNLTSPSIHASAVKVGDKAILIRGPSGSGKSRLAWSLILAGKAGQIAATTLVGDDRVLVDGRAHLPVVRPVPELAGLLEIRGLGIRRCEHSGEAKVELVVDLEAADGERLPPSALLRTNIAGHTLPRIAVPQGFDPLPLVLASLLTTRD